MVLVCEKGEKILKIFKGTEGPYRIENEGPWGGILYSCREKNLLHFILL